jgi:hypothetical protein
VRAVLIAAGLSIVVPAAVRAQTVETPRLQSAEVSVFYGYRFGGDFFEQVTSQPVDLDGAVAIGGTFNVPLHDDLSLEFFVTHQRAHLTVPPTSTTQQTRWTIDVDHYQVGGLRELQEYGTDQVRPFLTGALGLTRYASGGDNEVRFTIAGGGGVKVLPTEHVGVRLDGRVFATIIDIGGSAVACQPGLCLVRLTGVAVWQAEFTAAALVRF